MARAMVSIVSTMHNEWMDCHSHILPGIDDGSKCVEESIALLKAFSTHGVQTVWATPHFYPDQTIDTFLEARQQAYEALMQEVDEQQMEIPRILQGAEVLLSVDTPSLEGLERLCIEGTKYILIELPYTNWAPWVYEALYTIQAKHGLRPIIAHMERYEKLLSSIEKVNKLVEMDVIIQMNAYSLLGKRKRFAKLLVRKKMVHLLGSDTHRSKKYTGVWMGYEQITRKLGQQTTSQLLANANQVIANEKIEKPEAIPIRKLWKWYI